MDDFQQQLNHINEQITKQHAKLTKDGTIKLINAKPDWFAMAIVTADGNTYTTGNCDQLFPIQSMSKAFTYGIALEDHGREHLLSRIGVEPSGQSYNAIFLDEGTGRPPNPMVNAGAIAVASLIKGEDLTARINRVINILSRYAGRPLLVDAPTLSREFQTGDRNRAIAHLMQSFGMIEGSLEEAIHIYFQQCSLMVSVLDLAKMAATLANNGVHPFTDEVAVQKTYVRDILSVMYTCGMYDSSGKWTYKIGLPAKSGVSGGIFAVMPGKMGIATFAPHLNTNGHSILGIKAFELLAEQNDLHIFDCV